MYERSCVERKLLTVINATVSHEMRNPINSISALTTKQDQINQKLRILIDKIGTDQPQQILKEELIAIHEESAQTCKV